MEKGIEVDQAFKGISKSHSGLWIWRVENLQVVPLPKDQYGLFYDGDSYIVYAVSEYGRRITYDDKPQEIHGQSESHIHFWLGKESTQDERAVAAFKTVELDDYLGGAPVQHREVMECESERFKSYFKKRLRLLRGGIGSGLCSINNNFEPKLFRIKGRRYPLVTQMPSLSWQHFNSGDVFIVDTKDVVFVWVGRKSNSNEKLQAAKVAIQLKSEHKALSIVFIEEGKENDLLEAEKMLLGVYLDLNPNARRKIPEIINDDLQSENESRSSLRLYRCSDSDGTYKVTEVKTGPLEQPDLDHNDSFIIDNGPHHVWVWVGRKASPKERCEALRNALGFMKKKNYSENTKLSRVIDGGEPLEFKALFPLWRDQEKINILTSKKNGTNIQPILGNLIITSLSKNQQIAAREQLIDDGSGSCEVFIIKNSELIMVPVNLNGIFYSGACYIVKYTYQTNDGGRQILYFWKGEDSKPGEHAIKNFLQKNEVGSDIIPVRVAVVQGNEPPHFLTIFKGKFMTLIGDHKNKLPRVFMLQVKGNSLFNTKALQVEYKSSSLDSSDVFLIHTDTSDYVWCGKGSTGDEREVAKKLAKSIMNSDYELYFEGQEKDDFWITLGGKTNYKTDKRLIEIKNSKEPRLFQCSNLSGKFKVEEIMNFSQVDLISEDVMLLDAIHTIFIWIGEQANQEEKKKSIDFASEYLHSDISGRGSYIPIIQICQGFEPSNFVGFFPTWDNSLWKKQKTFDDIKIELNKQKPKLEIELKERNGDREFFKCEKFPIEILLEKDPEKLPSSVNLLHKEMHLTEENFSKVFKMTHSEFYFLPKWRQEKLKKAVGLF